MPTFGPTATERPGRFATIDFGAGLFRAGQLISDACAILCYGTCLDLNEGLLPKPIRFVTFAITREQWRSAVEGRNAPSRNGPAVLLPRQQVKLTRVPGQGARHVSEARTLLDWQFSL